MKIRHVQVAKEILHSVLLLLLVCMAVGDQDPRMLRGLGARRAGELGN